jgi:hypothetical protein
MAATPIGTHRFLTKGFLSEICVGSVMVPIQTPSEKPAEDGIGPSPAAGSMVSGSDAWSSVSHLRVSITRARAYNTT